MDILLSYDDEGFDLVKTPKDLARIDGLENMPLLGMFGGNVEASTPLERLESEEDFSYWGNTFLDVAAQFNSTTELALRKNALSSSGRMAIEEAVKKDLAFMRDFAEVTASVSITSFDRILISVFVKQPGNVQRKEFIFVWDATKLELTESE